MSAPYPPEWGTEPTWMTCPYCYGERTIRDRNDLDITCPICDGDGGWEP